MWSGLAGCAPSCTWRETGGVQLRRRLQAGPTCTETFLGYSVVMLPPPSNHEVELCGLSSQQKASCRAVLDAFLIRHDLASWGLIVALTESGPRAWQLEVSVTAPMDHDIPVRTTRLQVDKALDLAHIVDLCLETHYHACMNRRAAAQGSS